MHVLYPLFSFLGLLCWCGCSFLFREDKHEVIWEAGDIATHLLFQSLGLNAVQNGQIAIQHHGFCIVIGKRIIKPGFDDRFACGQNALKTSKSPWNMTFSALEIQKLAKKSEHQKV